jgi:hypothetical protein
MLAASSGSQDPQTALLEGPSAFGCNAGTRAARFAAAKHQRWQ